MAKTKKYGIAVTHPSGSIGWLIDPKNLKAMIFTTEKAASAAMAEYMSNKRYSWNLPIAVAEYHEDIEDELQV